MNFTCSICMESNRGIPARKCCGQLYCALCILKTRGLCYVCEKDTLTQANTCDLCNEQTNFFSVQNCMNLPCETQVCARCNNEALNGPMTFCSPKCNFEAFIFMTKLKQELEGQK